TDELLKLTFQASTAVSGNASIGFADDPIYREISDAGANTLVAEYSGSAVTVKALPSLKINQTDQNITLSWPSWATNFVLQESGDLGSQNWNTVNTTVDTSGGESVATIPVGGTARFYRLQQQ